MSNIVKKPVMDCGDSSCLYAVEKTGQRTNGGCRCVGRPENNSKFRLYMHQLESKISHIAGVVEDADGRAIRLNIKNIPVGPDPMSAIIRDVDWQAILDTVKGDE